MSKKATLVLAVIVALLGAYVAVFERDSLSSKELDERKGKVLRTFVRDRVTELGITRKGQVVRLERKRADDSWSPWRMLAPKPGDADQDAVDQLLGELEWLSARRLLDGVAASDRVKFGLEAPAFQVNYHVARDEHVLRIGGSDVHGEGHYATVDDEPTVYVIPKTLVEALDHEPSHFRTKQFLGEITSAWVRRVELVRAGKTHLLQKDHDLWWYAGEPKSYADGQRVQALIDALDTLRAVRYVEGEAKQAALAAIAQGARVTLQVIPDQHREDKQPEQFVLRFGGPCAGHEGERYAQRGSDGDPVCVRAADLAALEVDAPSLRLLRLFGVDPSEIERLELSVAGKHLQLQRSGEDWQAEGASAPNREAVESWLRDLRDQQAQDLAPRVSLHEDAMLELGLVNAQTRHIHVHMGEAASTVTVWRDDEGVSWSFPASLADRLQIFPQRFSSLTPWSDTQPSQVVGIAVSVGSVARRLLRSEGGWRNQESKPEVSDSARVRELVRQILKFRVLAVVTDHTRPEFSLAAPVAVLELTLAEGAKPLHLMLGAETKNGRYAQLGELIYEVDPELERLLSELATGQAPPADAGSALEPEEHTHEPMDDDEALHEHVH